MRAEPWVYRSLSGVNRRLQDTLGQLVSGLAPWPLYLYGPVGSGKTCAALAMCDASQEALYVTVREMADCTMNKSADLLWELVRTHDLAVLDEIGTRSSDLYYGIVEQFAETRKRHGRLAIYVSNLPPTGLKKAFDDRIADRLLCGTIFHLDSQSRRMPEETKQ